MILDNPNAWVPSSRHLVPGVAPTTAAAPSGSDAYHWARRVVERVRALWGTNKWMPWGDELTDETGEMRSSYRPMLADGVVLAAYRTQIYAVAALDAQVHPADPDNPRDREAADGFKLALTKLGCAHVAWEILAPGVMDGCSVCEKVWAADPESRGKYAGKRFWQYFKSKDTKFLTLEVDEFKNLTGIRSLQTPGGAMDPDDFVHWPHLSFFANKQGMSGFRAAFRPWWIKRQAIEFRQLHLEKFTGPYLRGQYTDASHKEALADALEEAKAGTYVTVPTGCIIDALDLSMKGTADYQAGIDDCNKEILIGIHGSHLPVMEGQITDARGDTRVQRSTGELIQWYLASQLGAVVSRQMAPHWYAENYADVEPGTVTWGAVNEADLTSWIDNSQKLQAMGLKLSQKEAYHYVARSQPADADDVLVPPAPAAPALPFEEDEQRPPFDLPD
jgi:hypothetical protein